MRLDRKAKYQKLQKFGFNVWASDLKLEYPASATSILQEAFPFIRGLGKQL